MPKSVLSRHVLVLSAIALVGQSSLRPGRGSRAKRFAEAGRDRRHGGYSLCRADGRGCFTDRSGHARSS